MSHLTEPTRQTPRPSGMPLDAYVEELFPVEPQHNDQPDRTVPIYDLLRPHESYLRKRFCYQTGSKPFEEAFDYQQYKGGLPFSCFSAFSFDELCKVWYSSSTSLQFECLFHPPSGVDADGNEPEVHRRLIGKIASSMWRWGCGHRDWNTVVAFYNALRRFDFGLPGFSVTLDHTTWYHDRGYSRHSRTYLDGAFGFLIHYRGEHVLTIGFSAGAGRRALVTQVQLVKAKGNRWLYKLPMSRVDYALSRLALAFPSEEGFTLHLADGRGLASRIKNSYREAGNAPNAKTLARVAGTYSAPLADYIRRGYRNVNQLRFHRLIRRPLDSTTVLVTGRSGFVHTPASSLPVTGVYPSGVLVGAVSRRNQKDWSAQHNAV